MKVISIQSSDKGFEGGIKPNKMANLAYSAMLSLSLLSAANSDVFTKSDKQEHDTELVQLSSNNETKKAGWFADNFEALFILGSIVYLINAFPKLLGKVKDNLTRH